MGRVIQMKRKDIIIAHYNEDLSWIERIPEEYNIIVYSKGVPVVGKELPNIGREAHTYLYHIVEHYDDLGDINIFCQGNPYPHYIGFDTQLEFMTTRDYKPLGDIVLRSDANGYPHHAGLEVEKASLELLGMRQNYYSFKPGGQFIVSKERILSKGKSYYQKLLDYTINDDKAPWVLERLWDLVFSYEGVEQDGMD